MKLLLTGLFIFLFLQSSADMIDDGSRQYYGAIVYVDSEIVILKDGCTNTRTTFRWSAGITVTFNTTCNHPGWTMSRSPAIAEDNCAKRKVFKFRLKESNVTSYADNFSAENGRLTITYVNSNDSQVLSMDNIEDFIDWVIYTDVCVDEIPASPPQL